MAIDFNGVTQRHIVAGLNWLSKMSQAEYWNLSVNETAALLCIELQVYEDILVKLKKGEPISLSTVTTERLSLLLGIWKMLQIWAPAGRMDIAIAAFNKANNSPELKCMSIKHYLLQSEGPNAFYAVKRFLNSH